jgi:DNA-binding transcriptional MerR regulator
VVELIRIRTLAEAGVPLARVRELLQADATEFAAAVAEIDEQLQAEIRQRQRLRGRIACLAAGDNLVLPSQLVEFLDRLRALGVDERIVQVEREGWIPLVARSPERVSEWIARKWEQIADPQLIDFYLTLGEALDRPDDRSLAELADKMASYITRLADTRGEHYLNTSDIEPPLVELLDTLAFDTWPPARRLTELLRQRGWTGWTELRHMDPARDVGRS